MHRRNVRQQHLMGVEPKIGGKKTPKWMVKIMENPIKIYINLWVTLFLETAL